jgi:hypothetical protein
MKLGLGGGSAPFLDTPRVLFTGEPWTLSFERKFTKSLQTSYCQWDEKNPR